MRRVFTIMSLTLVALMGLSCDEKKAGKAKPDLILRSTVGPISQSLRTRAFGFRLEGSGIGEISLRLVKIGGGKIIESVPVKTQLGSDGSVVVVRWVIEKGVGFRESTEPGNVYWVDDRMDDQAWIKRKETPSVKTTGKGCSRISEKGNLKEGGSIPPSEDTCVLDFHGYTASEIRSGLSLEELLKHSKESRSCRAAALIVKWTKK